MAGTVTKRPSPNKIARTLVTLAAGLLCAALAPQGARAIGESTLFDVRTLDYTGGETLPRASAPRRLAWEVRKRTSVETRLEPSRARLDDPSIFESPFLYWTGERRFPPLTDAEVVGLRRFVEFGGFVLIDDATPESDG